MKGFLFDVEFNWGFQARIAGMSKTSPSYIFPPPTSILGALSEAYARRKGLSESKSVETMNRLSTKLLALSYKSLNAIPITFQDINKIIAIRIAAGVEYPSAKNVYGSFDAPARGKTFLSSIDGRTPTIRIMLVFKDDIDITSEDLWKIKRIGSKESMTSTVNVIEENPKIVREPPIITQYLFPVMEGLEYDLDGEYVEQDFVPVIGQQIKDSPSTLYLSSMVVKHIIGVPFRNFFFRIRKLPKGFVGYEINGEVAIGIEG
ncbi:MAG: type I-A CRISPR-associated protein Cas5a [Candidatus Methanomethylicia archaeon]